MENLRQGGIASPEKAVVRQLQLSYAQNIDAVADSIEASLGLYRRVKELPSSATLLHLEEQLELHIKGPTALSSSNILTASNANRGMFTLKILRPFSDGLTSGYRTQREEILREALAVGELELSHPSVALVTIELLTVRDAESGREYNVLKMPRYLCTLGDNSKPRCWPRELVEEGMRMREAVQFSSCIKEELFTWTSRRRIYSSQQPMDGGTLATSALRNV